MKKYILIAVIILVLAILALVKIWSITIKDRNRLAANQEVLLSEIHRFKLADSSNAVTVGKLTLSVSEIRDASSLQLQEMKSTLKLMDIKLRQLESYSSVNTETVTNVSTFLRDSTVHDTIPIKYLSFRSRWNEVEITVFPSLEDSICLNVITYDQMEQVLWREPRGLKFWEKSFWRKRPVNQTIRFQNPGTKISYPAFIQVK